MENRCFEIGVDAVGNKNLIKLDELVLSTVQTEKSNMKGRHIVIASLSDDCHIRTLGEGAFLDKMASNDDAKEIGTEFSIPQSTIYRNNNREFFPSKGSFRIGISHKSSLTYFALSFTGSTSNNWKFSIDELKYCPKIKYISIMSEGNNLTGDISSLSGLTSLTNLHVWGNNLTGDISSLSGLTSLTNLNVGGNNLTGDISSLSGLTSLTNLSVGGNNLTGDISSLSGLTSLTNLSVDLYITGDVSSIIENCTKLKSLFLPRYTGMTEEQKKTLTDRGCTVTVAN